LLHHASRLVPAGSITVTIQQSNRQRKSTSKNIGKKLDKNEHMFYHFLMIKATYLSPPALIQLSNLSTTQPNSDVVSGKKEKRHQFSHDVFKTLSFVRLSEHSQMRTAVHKSRHLRM
jgi:hypothetical protein